MSVKESTPGWSVSRDDLRQQRKIWRLTGGVRPVEAVSSTSFSADDSKQGELMFISRLLHELMPEQFADEMHLYDDFMVMQERVFRLLWMATASESDITEKRAKEFVKELHNFTIRSLDKRWGTGVGTTVGHEAINAFLLLEPERAAECICVCSTLFLALALWWMDLFPMPLTYLFEIPMVMQRGHVLLVDRRFPTPEEFETTHDDICLWDWNPLTLHYPLTSFEVATQGNDVLALLALSIFPIDRATDSVDFIRQFVLRGQDDDDDDDASLETIMTRSSESLVMFSSFVDYCVGILRLLDVTEARDLIQRLESPFCRCVSVALDRHSPSAGGFSLTRFVILLASIVGYSRAVRLLGQEPSEVLRECIIDRAIEEIPVSLSVVDLGRYIPSSIFGMQLMGELYHAAREMQDNYNELATENIDDPPAASDRLASSLDGMFSRFTETLDLSPVKLWAGTMSFVLPDDLNDHESLIKFLRQSSWGYEALFSMDSERAVWWPLTSVGLDQLVANQPMAWHQAVYLMHLMDEFISTFPTPPDEITRFHQLMLTMRRDEDHDSNVPWEFLNDERLREKFITRMMDLMSMAGPRGKAVR